ncbi:MAG: phosphatidate cytidylyltransferase [Candidatus Competibacter sp.]|nr:phosphatidate cytidylyltransferase [Candidatus Competibacter sp.]MDG4584641.1 phosphatidate cytidylyltransferase [Candidatus Competibacter sp.]
MLKQRVITAVVLAVLVVWAVMKLPLAGFGLLLLVVVLLGAWEWAGLAGLSGLRYRLMYGGLVLTPILAFWPWVRNTAFVAGWLGCVLAGWCYALFWMWRYAARPERQDRPATVAVAGVIVLVAPWVALMALRDEFGPAYVLFLFLLVWIADIGAYFAGRRWGRRKLAVAISPGKTWEGVLGAGVAALIFALAGAAALNEGVRWPWFVAVCMVTVGFSIAGDLFESMLKRQCGKKDSGTLLPGHGGVLDRVDSLTAAAPVFLLGLYGMRG